MAAAYTTASTLTAMSTRGLAGIGNVDPGEIEVTITHPTLTCVRGSLAWPGSADNKALALVEANALSILAGFVCE